MTENEAKTMLRAKLTCMDLESLYCLGKGCNKDCDDCVTHYAQGTMREQKDALKVAIQALEEIQSYREIGTVEDIQLIFSLCKDLERQLKRFEAIGTIEEFKALKEKNEPKKPIPLDKWGEYHKCPVCGRPSENSFGCSYKFCPNCGCKYDWGNE